MDLINHGLLWGAGPINDPEIRWLRDKLYPVVKGEFATSEDPRLDTW
jgi:hypothetical protein